MKLKYDDLEDRSENYNLNLRQEKKSKNVKKEVETMKNAIANQEKPI